MQSKLRWGILGAGHIAGEFADGVSESETGTLLAVASRTQESADRFADRYRISRRYVGYQALLDDPEIDAVYIATLHPMHAEWAIKAAESGKHILVEKPIGMNAFEAAAILDAAQANDVFLMEAFMYRCHPQTLRLAEMIREKVIGDVQLIQASFSYHGGENLESRAYAEALGGGGILDVGCYPASAARLIAGAAQGKSFAEPTELKAVGHLGETGVDYWSSAVAKFPGNIIAELTTGVGMQLPDASGIKVYGTKGYIIVPNPWIPSRWNRNPGEIRLRLYSEKTEQVILVQADKDLYTYEADMVGHHIAGRQAPAMSWDDTLGNMRLLDRWRREIGLLYHQEKLESAPSVTVAGRSLSRRPDAKMQYGHIAGVDKPISRLVIGADTNHFYADTAILFDAYFERGGNTFDTSHQYGHGGSCEKNLGHWIKKRGVREQVVVLQKGANRPENTPEGLTRQLVESLERMQLDYVDIYMIHRDYGNIPMDEWIDVLNQNQRAGRMRIFGVSNFSLDRIKAGMEYARQSGQNGFSAVSNNFSLAEMLDPVWDFCVSTSDAEARAYFKSIQMPIMPWSSQARGFFTPRASRENTADPEFNRCWYSEDNFRRKERCEILARQYNVEPINIALAYVLCQPFPTFPLVGPKRPREIDSSLRALDLHLSPEELLWLNLEMERKQ